MTEIIPGIYQVQVPIPNNPLGYTNSYLVQGDNGHLLIDPGMNTDEAFDSLERGLSEIGVDFKDITQILATHSHGDHYGLSGRVKQRSQAKILLHHLERNPIQLISTNMEERLRQTEQWLHINGAPTNEPPAAWLGATGMPRFTPPPLPDITLDDGETISTGTFDFQVMWTPGHSPGHICLYEPTKKILFSGDHVLPVITPHVSLGPQSTTNPLGDFINALNTLRQLDVNLVLPAHEHLFTDLQARIDDIIQHHEKRNSEILEAINTEPKTAYQISTKITWKPDLGGLSLHDLTPWEKRMAVMETLAHLQSMRIAGRVEQFSSDSIIYYQHT